MTVLLDIARDFDAVLLDAYGVLVDARGALPGAAEALTALRGAGVPFYVATNDASRLASTITERFAGFDMSVPPDRVITSGSLIAPYFAEHDLVGARCIVLGTDDSRAYVRAAGGVVVPTRPDAEIDAVVVCDEAGFEFLPSVEASLTAVARAIEAGRTPHLVQPNPDLIYPKRDGEYGFTSGAATLLLEAGLERRFPELELRFTPLGKPGPMIFEEAARRAGSRNLLMVGDQIETDIVGAQNAGFAAALLIGGVTHADDPRLAALPDVTVLHALVPQV